MATPRRLCAAGSLLFVLAGSSPGLAQEVRRPGAVRLHVESDVPGVELRVFDRWVWHHVRRVGQRPLYLSRSLCVAPCDEVIDARASWYRYYFGGHRIVASDVFRLDERSGPLSVRVEAGYRPARELGAALLGLGTGATLGSAFMLGFASLDAGQAHTLRVTSGALLAPAVSMVVAGAVLYAVNRTRFTFLQDHAGSVIW